MSFSQQHHLSNPPNLQDLNDHRTIIMAELMTPDKANFIGNVHGGHLISILDRVAACCAQRYSRNHCVTLSVDRILFKEPIHIGDLVVFYAKVNYVGNTSMEIGIRVMSENLLTGVKRHTNTCYFTMVAVDKNQKPTKVEPLILRTEEEKERFEAAKQRREQQRANEKKKA
jgi:acyl-CoA hydrolase